MPMHNPGHHDAELAGMAAARIDAKQALLPTPTDAMPSYCRYTPEAEGQQGSAMCQLRTPNLQQTTLVMAMGIVESPPGKR